MIDRAPRNAIEAREMMGQAPVAVIEPDPHNIGGKAVAMDKAGVEPVTPTSKQNEEKAIDPSKTEDQQTKELINWAESQSIFNSDDSVRLNAFTELDANGLSQVLIVLHQLVAPDTEVSPNPTATKLYSPENVHTGTLMDPEERYIFLQKSCEQVKTLARQATEEAKKGNNLAAKIALIRISNVLALSTVITHPFEDGNGRTSRSLALLTRDGVPSNAKEKSDLILVSKNRPAKGFRIMGFVPKYLSDDDHEVWDKSIKGATGVEYPLTQEGQALYEKQKGDFFASPFTDDVLA